MFGVVVGMLVGDDVVEERRRRDVVHRIALGKFVQAVDEADLAFRAELHDRRQPVRLVETAGRNRDPVLRLVGHRRAAVFAETAPHMVGGVEILELAARPGQLRLAGCHQRRVIGAERLLAHAAMADRGIRRIPDQPEADRAALAAAGMDDIAHGRPSAGASPCGQIAVSWSGCWRLLAETVFSCSGVISIFVS